jgi:hypothetical protein
VDHGFLFPLHLLPPVKLAHHRGFRGFQNCCHHRRDPVIEPPRSALSTSTHRRDFPYTPTFERPPGESCHTELSYVTKPGLQRRASLSNKCHQMLADCNYNNNNNNHPFRPSPWFHGTALQRSRDSIPCLQRAPRQWAKGPTSSTSMRNHLTRLRDWDFSPLGYNTMMERFRHHFRLLTPLQPRAE